MARLILRSPRLTIHYKDTILVTDREGWVHEGRTGLFSRDTRYISTYRLTLNGFAPRLLGADQPHYFAATFYYTNPTIGAKPHAIPANSLLLKLSRFVREGVHEDLTLTNYAGRPVSLTLALGVDADFADIFQVRGLAPVRPRLAESYWDGDTASLSMHYHKESFTRTLHLRFVDHDSQPDHAVGTIVFPIALSPGQTWHACLEAYFEDHPAFDHASAHAVVPIEEELAAWQSASACLEAPETPAELGVARTYEQAILDLASLRLERVSGQWFPAAGVPWYVAVFGRDSLIAALQSLGANLPFGMAVLERLAQLQGTGVDAWRDEEPGRIHHELRHDELTCLGKLYFSPYYGSVDASLLYPIMLHELYSFTLDRGILERFYAPAVACLEWAARSGDLDGDGFVEYRPLLPTGYRNQAWKDSGTAVVYPDGTLVDDPIAIVEVQGYYYDALRRMADIARLLGRDESAEAYARRAKELYERFDEAYWWENEGTYAFGLDPRKQQIRSVASNPGHALWSRVAPPERAVRVARRLLAEDMFSGWGIRTLSARNPAYDPLSYQRGSVWPHDNGLIALGFKRYGLWREANQVAEAIFAAAARYERHSLPEVFAGLDRAAGNQPVPYAETNIPQAWAAGSVLMLVQAILGLEPDPIHRRLVVAPTLPDWLPELTLRNFTIFGQRLDLRFRGLGLASTVEVLRNEGALEIETRRGDEPSGPLLPTAAPREGRQGG